MEDIQQENSSESASNQPNKSNDVGNYVVVGTLSNSEATKPDWVAEVVEASIIYYSKPQLSYMVLVLHIYQTKREDILSAIMSCDIIIYQVTGLMSQIEEALWAVECEDQRRTLQFCFFILVWLFSTSWRYSNFYFTESLYLHLFYFNLGTQ